MLGSVQSTTFSRRTLLIGSSLMAVVGVPSEAFAQGLTYTVPSGLGIKRYTARRDRAEVSQVTLEYFSYPTGRWIIDNVQEPQERKNIDVDVALTRPAAFRASRHPRQQPLRVRLSGSWMPNNSDHNPMAKTTAAQFADRLEIYMYAKQDDPAATIVAKLFYDKPIPA